MVAADAERTGMRQFQNVQDVSHMPVEAVPWVSAYMLAGLVKKMDAEGYTVWDYDLPDVEFISDSEIHRYLLRVCVRV